MKNQKDKKGATEVTEIVTEEAAASSPSYGEERPGGSEEGVLLLIPEELWRDVMWLILEVQKEADDWDHLNLVCP